MEKRILILSNSLSFGGGEKIAANLFNGLCNKGLVTNIATIENEKTYDIVNDQLWVKNPFYSVFGGGFLNNLFFTIYLIYFIKKNNIDYVISHLFRANYINVISSFFSKHKAIIVTHGSIKKYKDTSGFKSKINLTLITILFKHSYKKVFLTERMKNDYVEYVGSESNFVINNCYDLESIHSLSSVDINNCPFSHEDYFIFVGRNHEVKNTKLILEEFKRNNKNLLVIGSGFENEKRSYICNNICFLGSVKNPYPYIKNAKALLLSSFSEGFPNVIVEALCLKTFVISSDCRTGPREILDHSTSLSKSDFIVNNNGILYSVNDLIGFKKAIIFFDRSNMILNKSQIKSMDKYSIDSITEEYFSICS
ncbi:glycosyltransferase [Vibrio tritonius]|uniref:glycosyltransferase n=1 Tax=Vibrio tritonius TaxID=1435069 RepID=UPI00315CE697